jgi:hypothetical protein
MKFSQQTHSKISKKSHPGQTLSVTPDETIPAASELPPYGTSHAVCTIIFLRVFPLFRDWMTLELRRLLLLVSNFYTRCMKAFMIASYFT